MDKYYGDEEIIDIVKDALRNSVEAERIAHLVSERFAQKDRQRDHILARLNEAANMIGHSAISENMQYE